MNVTASAPDPPRHTALRKIVSKAFTPRRIVALEPHIHAIVDDLLDQAPGTGSWDFVSGFAGPLPAIVIADMLGVIWLQRRWKRPSAEPIAPESPPR